MKMNRNCIDKGGFHPLPGLPPIRYFFGQGSPEGCLRLAEIQKTVLILTGVAKAAGQSPGSVSKFQKPPLLLVRDISEDFNKACYKPLAHRG
jgi:hypothetical protein